MAAAQHNAPMRSYDYNGSPTEYRGRSGFDESRRERDDFESSYPGQEGQRRPFADQQNRRPHSQTATASVASRERQWDDQSPGRGNARGSPEAPSRQRRTLPDWNHAESKQKTPHTDSNCRLSSNFVRKSQGTKNPQQRTPPPALRQNSAAHRQVVDPSTANGSKNLIQLLSSDEEFKVENLQPPAFPMPNNYAKDAPPIQTPAERRRTSYAAPMSTSSNSVTSMTSIGKKKRIECVMCKRAGAPIDVLVQCSKCALRYHTSCHAPKVTCINGEPQMEKETWCCRSCKSKGISAARLPRSGKAASPIFISDTSSESSKRSTSLYYDAPSACGPEQTKIEKEVALTPGSATSGTKTNKQLDNGKQSTAKAPTPLPRQELSSLSSRSDPSQPVPRLFPEIHPNGFLGTPTTIKDSQENTLPTTPEIRPRQSPVRIPCIPTNTQSSAFPSPEKPAPLLLQSEIPESQEDDRHSLGETSMSLDSTDARSARESPSRSSPAYSPPPAEAFASVPYTPSWGAYCERCGTTTAAKPGDVLGKLNCESCPSQKTTPCPITCTDTITTAATIASTDTITSIGAIASTTTRPLPTLSEKLPAQTAPDEPDRPKDVGPSRKRSVPEREAGASPNENLGSWPKRIKTAKEIVAEKYNMVPAPAKAPAKIAPRASKVAKKQVLPKGQTYLQTAKSSKDRAGKSRTVSNSSGATKPTSTTKRRGPAIKNAEPNMFDSTSSSESDESPAPEEEQERNHKQVRESLRNHVLKVSSLEASLTKERAARAQAEAHIISLKQAVKRVEDERRGLQQVNADLAARLTEMQDALAAAETPAPALGSPLFPPSLVLLPERPRADSPEPNPETPSPPPPSVSSPVHLEDHEFALDTPFGNRPRSPSPAPAWPQHCTATRKERITQPRFDSLRLMSLHLHHDTERYSNPLTARVIKIRSTDEKQNNHPVEELGRPQQMTFAEFTEVPPNLVPCSKDNHLGFREGIINPRTRRVERSVPFHRVIGLSDLVRK